MNCSTLSSLTEYIIYDKLSTITVRYNNENPRL